MASALCESIGAIHSVRVAGPARFTGYPGKTQGVRNHDALSLQTQAAQDASRAVVSLERQDYSDDFEFSGIVSSRGDTIRIATPIIWPKILASSGYANERISQGE